MRFIFRVLNKEEGPMPKTLYRFIACCFLYGNGASSEDVVSILAQLFPSEDSDRKVTRILERFKDKPWKFHYFDLNNGQRMTMDGGFMSPITRKNTTVRKVNTWSEYCFWNTTSLMIEQRELALERALDPDLLEMLDASSV